MMKRSTRIWILAGASFLAIAGFLLASQLTMKIGFPLDDAWIHQTYARNIYQFGEWSFIPGKPSGGSTSPLWSLLLTPGYLLPNFYLIWTFLVGGLTLWGVGFITMSLLESMGIQPVWALVGGISIMLEWHLVWAAASGMETLAFSLAVLLVLALLVKVAQNEESRNHWQTWTGLGVLAGITLWLRPEGLTLVGPLVFTAILVPGKFRKKLSRITSFSAGLVLLFLPYLYLNYQLTGTIWPNTFFAKQAEYASLLELPLLHRIASIYREPLIGVGLALLPGFFRLGWTSLKDRQWAVLSGMLWAVGQMGLYVLRMPVVYQHARYLIPGMAAYFIFGLAGLLKGGRFCAEDMLGRVFSRSWGMITVLLLLGFYVQGAAAYGRDVAIIETEMVDVAHWVAENTEPDVLVAAHDIGALGYFGGRELLDLAGLITPDVISFIRDESSLWVYMEEQGADYLVTFPDWYDTIPGDLEQVYSSGGEFSPRFGQENMGVYLFESQNE